MFLFPYKYKLYINQYKFELDTHISNNTYLEANFYLPSTSSYRDSTVFNNLTFIRIDNIIYKHKHIYHIPIIMNKWLVKELTQYFYNIRTNIILTYFFTC
jgi:hypothetical protein